MLAVIVLFALDVVKNTLINGKILEKYGRVFKKSVKEMDLKNACILDPGADKSLTIRESQGFRILSLEVFFDTLYPYRLISINTL